MALFKACSKLLYIILYLEYQLYWSAKERGALEVGNTSINLLRGCDSMEPAVKQERNAAPLHSPTELSLDVFTKNNVR